MDSATRQRIIAENIKVHAVEAGIYDQIHAEMFNWYIQRKFNRDLDLISKLVPPGRALDIGSGTGNLTFKLLDRGFCVNAVDISEEMLGRLRRKAASHPRKEALTIMHADADASIVEAHGPYHVITFSSVLHHLPDYEQTLRRAAELLAPGGIIYVAHEPTGFDVPAPRKLRGKLYLIDRLIWRKRIYRYLPILETLDWSYSDYQIFHGFSSKKVLRVLADSGMTIVKRDYHCGYATLGLTAAIDNFVFRPKTTFHVIAQCGTSNAAAQPA
ncbi:MAG TPA: methyltransferase [Chloroflexia bacterium]